MSNELATTKQNALEYLDIQESERIYLLGIMAEQLGIPAEDAQRTDVQGLIAKAVERNRNYGWEPGVHMHVQSFMSKVRDDQNRETGERERKYTLVDGEKAWKDSVAQWRIQHGVILRYQRKPMLREEIESEVRSMGFTQAIPVNAYGMWCRVIEHGVDDPKDPDFPDWSAGVWFGKIKTGTFWTDDHLPTGVSPRDVAIRRGDKRAMMQSSFGLLELDRRSPEERSAALVENLRQESQYHNPTPPDTATREQFVIESDGDILWAADPASTSSTKTPSQQLHVYKSTDGHQQSNKIANMLSDSNDVDFRIENTGDGISILSPDPVDGESTVDDNPFEDDTESTVDDDFSPFAEIYHNPDFELYDTTKSLMEEFRELHESSGRAMSGDGYKLMKKRYIEEGIMFDGQGATPFIYFMEALCMTKIDGVPGARVGKRAMEVLNDESLRSTLKQIAILVDTTYQDMLEA